jgi:hypothetical protein
MTKPCTGAWPRIVVSVAFVAAVPIYLYGHAGAPGPRKVAPRVGFQRDRDIDRGVRAAFEIERTPRRTVDELPPAVAADARRLGMDPSTARFAGDAGTSHLFVAAGRQRLCVIDSRQVLTNCWPKAEVLRGGAGMAALCAANLPPGTVELAGLVPDGVTSVRFRAPDGKVIARHPSRNLWRAIVRSRNPLPVLVVWRRYGRTTRHPTGIPARVRAAKCGHPR